MLCVFVYLSACLSLSASLSESVTERERESTAVEFHKLYQVAAYMHLAFYRLYSYFELGEC